MTPIQEQSLPAILKGGDLIAQAKTGSGKTAAFALGVLQQLNNKRFRPQALVLCPTRELADQVAKEFRSLARQIENVKVLTLCGGQPFGPQVGSLEHGAHIVVGTPGRVEAHLRKGNLKTQDIATLVFDEADRMLDMGFQESIDTIMGYLPEKRQNLLFSATFPPEIDAITRRVLHNPTHIRLKSDHSASTIDQRFYSVDSPQSRLDATLTLLYAHQAASAIIFCATKKESQALADDLADSGFSALAIHGDLDQRQREQALTQFANKSLSVLVATDVAARGLDIDDLDLVINFHMSRDPEVHVHRIGRTGRQGATGVACTLVSPKDDEKCRRLEDLLPEPISLAALPHVPDDKCLPVRAAMQTLQIDGGKKQKVRPGDVLGALTAGGKIQGKQVGKIHVMDFCTYVAVESDLIRTAMNVLNSGKIKGRNFKARGVR
ncbi:ATP-dependent RNA helicase DbpA [BD1-7 clade bacterium]|nr:ATP-dependent RNA helicase DbpA [BD1-7 clade bacterium]